MWSANLIHFLQSEAVIEEKEIIALSHNQRFFWPFIAKGHVHKVCNAVATNIHCFALYCLLQLSIFRKQMKLSKYLCFLYSQMDGLELDRKEHMKIVSLSDQPRVIVSFTYLF